MLQLSVTLVVVLASAVRCIPVQDSEKYAAIQDGHNIQKRFINPLFSWGAAENDDLAKIRTKRSEDECEKLQLCKLHAHANRNFFSAFELYFVNKENARQWDHHARSAAECYQRYGDCYDK